MTSKLTFLVLNLKKKAANYVINVIKINDSFKKGERERTKTSQCKQNANKYLAALSM